jgi:hypothetical protein
MYIGSVHTYLNIWRCKYQITAMWTYIHFHYGMLCPSLGKRNPIVIGHMHDRPSCQMRGAEEIQSRLVKCTTALVSK